ncbi:MarR family winged helix-turn-helix transcriptional regulator [Sphingobacterium pedocola]|uniref:MarR family transcriptional regulator n=1 Tax=Sphingobacterium pedocola TaxID=2082722 RepID=A0ABR9TD57_9SPHI|nr:MarR family transcriptional regulator [Sphingobacterium pedocola]MBE8722557.1 MarR family transcriptional regulator [Sphingobacterium pedocola]
MKINELLKVKKFRDDWHKATLNIIYTNSWIVKKLEQRANKKDITLQQFNVLRILRGQYPKAASNNLLKERMINSTPDISRLVDRIVAKGLVMRSKNTLDKRSVDLWITDRGLQLLDEIEEDMMLTDLINSNITEQEALQLSSLLDKFRGSMNMDD